MRVLVIGDSATDAFITVDSQRLSPEVPVPIVVPYSISTNPGMAANVAANISSLAPNFDVVTRFPEHPSVKTRYVDRKTNHHFLRVDQDASSEPMSGIDWLKSIMMCPNAIVLSDYAKGYLTLSNMERVAQFCAINSVPLFADTKSLLDKWSHGIDFVKINEVELATHLKEGRKPWEECRNLIVTKGGDGMDLYDNDGSIAYHSPGVRAEVADSAGCGDSVLAGLVVKYLVNGNNIRTAMDYANRVGAVAVSKRGVVAVKREEVE